MGPAGQIPVPLDDQTLRKLAMLIEGQCESRDIPAVLEKYGYGRARYYELLQLLKERGLLGLVNAKRGPKTTYRRTKELQRQVIRHRFLDPDASVHVITQKLRQTGFDISIRSVERVIEDYGLQKKTLHVPARPRAPRRD